MAQAGDAPKGQEPFLGADGAATLVLACAVAASTLGLSLALALWRVIRMARGVPAMPPRSGTSPRRLLVLGLRLPADGVPCATFRARLDRACAIAEREAGMDVIVLGGQTRSGAPSEAEAGLRYLTAAGLAPRRLRLEARSRHTLENLRNYRAAFAAAGVSAPDLLVTSRFHLARASLMAQGLGLSHLPCAAEDRLRLSAREAARLMAEAFLLHWYLVGRGFARMTRNRAMLARIS